MKTGLSTAASAFVALLSACASAPGAGLAVGDPAPDFDLPGSDGRRHSLSEHAGKRPVVIAWFPKAFTGG